MQQDQEPDHSDDVHGGDRRRDMLLFQMLHRAQRTKLPANWCGYHLPDDGTLACFPGHGDFDDPQAWVEHYPGASWRSWRFNPPPAPR